MAKWTMKICKIEIDLPVKLKLKKQDWKQFSPDPFWLTRWRFLITSHNNLFRNCSENDLSAWGCRATSPNPRCDCPSGKVPSRIRAIPVFLRKVMTGPSDSLCLSRESCSVLGPRWGSASSPPKGSRGQLRSSSFISVTNHAQIPKFSLPGLLQFAAGEQLLLLSQHSPVQRKATFGFFFHWHLLILSHILKEKSWVPTN